jgi:hypothetical protein
MEATESVGLVMVKLETHSWDCLIEEGARDRSALGWMFEVYCMRGAVRLWGMAGRDPRPVVPAMGTTLPIITCRHSRMRYLKPVPRRLVYA